jgi:predicted PolB exonuclease-like 3'-5' exonuclease
MSFLVFDIETIPDRELWTPAEAPKKRGKAAGEEPFAPHYAHIPIAIGFALLSDELELQQIGVAGTTTFGTDEAKLIAAFHTFAEQVQPTLVTYNGRGFDMPVLSLRSFKHGLAQGWYSAAHRKKYSEERHIDIMEQLTEYGVIPFKGFSLDKVAKLIGLPGKLGFDGSLVAAAYAAGNAKEIELYAQQDVAQTTLVFLRYMLMRGRVTLPQYQQLAEVFLNTCGGKGMTFVEKTDRAKLLLQAPA